MKTQNETCFNLIMNLDQDLFKTLAFMLIDEMNLSDLRLVESYASVVRESLEKEKQEKEKS